MRGARQRFYDPPPQRDAPTAAVGHVSVPTRKAALEADSAALEDGVAFEGHSPEDSVPTASVQSVQPAGGQEPGERVPGVWDCAARRVAGAEAHPNPKRRHIADATPQRLSDGSTREELRGQQGSAAEEGEEGAGPWDEGHRRRYGNGVDPRLKIHGSKVAKCYRHLPFATGLWVQSWQV